MVTRSTPEQKFSRRRLNQLGRTTAARIPSCPGIDMSHKQAGYIYADCAGNHFPGLPDGGGPYIFCRASCSIVLSRDRSATSRFSLGFSSSIWRSFLTSDGIIPPYRLRPLVNVASEIPAFRQTFATAVPLSACFRTDAICASVNFDFFVEFSSSHSRDHKWKIPARNGPFFRRQVATRDGRMKKSRFLD